MLVFEDLHWADDGLLDFVDHLVDWATGVPILVVGTARPELLERRPGWGGGKANATTLSLSPLSNDDTARLLGSLLGRPLLEAGEQADLLARAGGNPLYAEQYAQMLAERGDGEELPLPESVQGIIGARLDALSPEEKRLLQDAAVIGKVFWPGAVARARQRRGSTTGCTRSSASSSSAASGAPRWPRRRSTRSSTCCCATWRTARSRGRAGSRSTR